MLKRTAYCCGPTVHSSQHVGNYKTFYKSIKDFNKSKKRNQVMLLNVTDISEDIYEKSGSKPAQVLVYVNRYVRQFVRALNLMGLKPWTLDIQRTSFNLKLMKRDVKNLLNHPLVSKVADGCVITPGSKQQTFYLWRIAPKISIYDSSFLGSGYENAKGIPGWHNECYSLIKKYVSPKFVHFGGSDLKPIHHKNEKFLLQLERPYQIEYRYSGTLMLKEDGSLKKISKSAGNVPFDLSKLLNTGQGRALIKKFMDGLSFRSNSVLDSKQIERCFTYYRKVDLRSRNKVIGVMWRRFNTRLHKDLKSADRVREQLKYTYKIEDLKSSFRIERRQRLIL